MSALAGRLSSLPEQLAAWASELQAPGVSVGVLDSDEVEVFTAGLANVSTGLPVRPDTLFQIGSNTKLWTATVVMQLVDLGQLALDAPVPTYLPGFTLAGVDARTVTVRHLLTHTAGFFGDWFGDDDTDSVAAYAEGVSRLPQLHPVGEDWSYCNSGWVLLGRVIETVTGLDYATAVHRLLLDPLGATSTFMDVHVDADRTAMGYLPDPASGQLAEAPYGVMRACAPAGSIPTSTPADVLRFVRMHLDQGRSADGRVVLRPESTAAMQARQVALPSSMAPTSSMGLGWMRRSLTDGQHCIGHSGGTASGHVSRLEVVPHRRAAVCVLTNGGGGSVVADRAVEHVLQVLTGAGLARPEVTWPDPPLALAWTCYTGTYGAGPVSIEVAQSAGPGQLLVTMGQGGGAQQLPLRALTPSTFGVLGPGSGPKVEFLDVDDGTSGTSSALRIMGRFYPRVS